jgi:pimeloyl-ACP methyl ester carboxylesterase
MLVSALVPLALAATRPAAPPRFEPGPCAERALEPRARCGVVRVPEDRSNPGGRSIALNIVILPSTPQPARLPPLFDIDGGPGLPASKNAGFYAANGISAGRDVVMIEQRGTGRSNGLHCPELQDLRPTEPMLPRAKVEQCLARLRDQADLRFYGTADGVEDLEAVRRALGYEKIDLFGLSYGTTVALAYMRGFPGNVRAAILMGVAPPDAMPPRRHSTAGARALDLLLADCAAEQGCRKAFPRLQDDLARARANAKAAGFTDETFMERLRSMMYAPSGRARLPLIIHKAAKGDFQSLLSKAPDTGASMIADGMFLAVTCGESFELMDYAKADAAARATPFGDYRLRQQRAACEGWPRVRLAPDHLELPRNTSAAILLISGGMDPVTPPEWAEALVAQLPRARHLVVPKGGHIPDGLSGLESCLDPLMIQFLDHADPKALDASCIETMAAPVYSTE